MAQALTATVIALVGGRRHAKTFELTASCRSQVLELTEALDLTKTVDGIDGDWDSVQIPVEIFEKAAVEVRGFSHVNGREVPESVASALVDLKQAIYAAAGKGVTPAVFVGLA